MFFRKKKSRPEIWTFNDLTRLYTAAAAMTRELARLAVSRRGRFVVALAGGEVYRPLYEALANGSARSSTSSTARQMCSEDNRPWTRARYSLSTRPAFSSAR